MSTAAVILAAGRGTRMRSDRAKVLHEIGGLPLVTWVVRAVRPLVDRTIVVVGHDREAVRLALASEGVSFAVQDPQEGTGPVRVGNAQFDGGRQVVIARDLDPSVDPSAHAQ